MVNKPEHSEPQESESPPSFRTLIVLTVVYSKFSGHVAIPSLIRDMDDPTQYERMIDTAYSIATGLYGIIGVAGTLFFFEFECLRSLGSVYCMFGNSMSEEFSEDMFSTPGYNKLLNKVALYALTITPM